jgi:hypothetical protein
MLARKRVMNDDMVGEVWWRLVREEDVLWPGRKFEGNKRYLG